MDTTSLPTSPDIQADRRPGPLARLGIILADRAHRNTSLPFPTGPALPPPDRTGTPGAGTGETPVPPGQAGETTGTRLPVAAGRNLHPAGWAGTNRPGAGLRSNTCLYLDEPEHRCVNETGQPSNLTCIASEYRRSRPAKEIA